MQKEFLGFHSEWNMGSPGGWDYQRMAQEVGKFAWERIRQASGIDVQLDFDNDILNPVPLFAQTILRAHEINYGKSSPFVVLVAEKETLEKVGENIRFVKYLNSLHGVKDALTDPSRLEQKNGNVYFNGDKVTVIFQDFNNNVIAALKKDNDLSGLLRAIEQGIVVNPRGTEPIGVKGVFEAVTGEYKDKMSVTTAGRTPWTRQFFPRKTTGPDGKEIADLVKWVKDNWAGIILKPVHGHSGKGIIIGFMEPEIDKSIDRALAAGHYIVQPLVPVDLWAEEFPWLDRENKKVFLKKWQTDFRCFITDKGPIGFVTRFGGIPTNVGSGGGIQSTAILRSSIPLAEAIKKVNEAIIGLGYEFISELQEEIDKKSLAIGNIYMLGPIMCTLRPRILTDDYIKQIWTYGQNLWQDALTLEDLWLNGKLNEFVQIPEEEESIARLAPWRGKPAIIASDGLFSFR